MTGTAADTRWARIRELKPRLRAHVRVRRRDARGERWYVLVDGDKRREHRINAAAYELIGRCDGRHTLHAVLIAARAVPGTAATSEDDVVRLFAELSARDLLQIDGAPPVAPARARQRTRSASLVNPLAFRVSLGDPSAWLRRLDPLVHWLFHPLVLLAWACVVTLAAVCALSEWDAVRAHAVTHLATPRYVALAWLIYPCMKLLHELGHALAVRRWGGEVKDCGIGLLVLVPAPYVDASAASAFPQRSRRIVVGAAGVMVELALAAAAYAVWCNVEAGLVQDIAFVVMSIGAIASVLFNANPLLRFDGYFVLCDALELPNLGQRSAAWWSALLGRTLLGLRQAAPPLAPGERRWLLAYAPLSYGYRLALACAVVLWLGAHAALLGTLTAIYFAFGLLLVPVLRWARHALTVARAAGPAGRTHVRLALVGGSALCAICVVPLPFATVAPGVVWLPDDATLRVAEDGFVVEVLQRDGAHVTPGALIARLANPALRAERSRAASQLAALRADRFRHLLHDALAAGNLGVEIARAEAALVRADERLAGLEVRAGHAGMLAMPRQADMPGRYLRRGEVLGQVIAPGEVRVRVAVEAQAADMVRYHSGAVAVRLNTAPGIPRAARVVGGTPAATHLLPSAALGDRAGGPFVTDLADSDGRHSLAPVAIVDLALAGAPLERVGERAWVRFTHPSAPLAAQLYRAATNLLLAHFNPTS